MSMIAIVMSGGRGVVVVVVRIVPDVNADVAIAMSVGDLFAVYCDDDDGDYGDRDGDYGNSGVMIAMMLTAMFSVPAERGPLAAEIGKPGEGGLQGGSHGDVGGGSFDSGRQLWGWGRVLGKPINLIRQLSMRQQQLIPHTLLSIRLSLVLESVLPALRHMGERRGHPFQASLAYRLRRVVTAPWLQAHVKSSSDSEDTARQKVDGMLDFCWREM
eukprot:scaffold117496_cov33-Prasinocladus_malaysianus.AAC.1